MASSVGTSTSYWTPQGNVADAHCKLHHSPSSDSVKMHTLRIRFKAEASEAQVRNLLVGTGARFIGGPTQLGDYWVASNFRSLDEMMASLQQSGLVPSMKVDFSGPQGQ